MIDKTGKEILTCIYDSVEDFSKTFLEIYLDGEKYFYNKYKREKYNFSFDAYREGYDDYFPNDWKKEEIEEIYRNAFDKDVHTIELEGNYGYINKAGEEVIPCKYNLANNFIQGIAKVEINGLEGYINKKGDEYWED